MTYQNRSFPQKRAKLEESLVVWDGVTTANGAPGFTSLIDASLIGANDFISNQVTVIILGGMAGSPIFEKAGATGFNPITGEITFPAMTARVMAGTPYRLLNAGGPVDLAPVITAIGTVATTTDTLARNDGVYFDELLGAAGTAYPIGLPATPVSNLADALLIMTARNLKKLYLAGTGAHAITLTTGINIQIVGNAEYAVTITAGATVTIGSDLLCKSFTNTTGTPTINGNLTSMTTISTTTGTITVWGNAYAGTTTDVTNSGTLTVYGNAVFIGIVSVQTGGITVNGNAFFGWYNGNSGTLTINGNFETVGSLNNTASTVVIKKNCKISNNLASAQGNITITGNCEVGGTIDFTNTGDLVIYGDAKLMGTVTTSNASATITIGSNAFFGASYVGTSGALTVNGNLEIVVSLTNTAATVIVSGTLSVSTNVSTTTGNITIGGDTHIDGSLASTGAGDIIIWGSLYVGSTTTMSAASATLTVHGNAVLIGAVGATNAAATITIDGFAQIYGAITATGTVTYHGNLNCLDFWSATQALVSLTDTAAPGTDTALPNVVVAALPVGAKVSRATAYFKYRVLENSNVAANKLQGDQNIQVQKGGGGGYVTGIALVDDLLGIAGGPLREGGDVLMGNTDLAAKVTGNDTYNFQWTAALVDQANLNFYDVQVGLRVWFTI